MRHKRHKIKWKQNDIAFKTIKLSMKMAENKKDFWNRVIKDKVKNKN